MERNLRLPLAWDAPLSARAGPNALVRAVRARGLPARPVAVDRSRSRWTGLDRRDAHGQREVTGLPTARPRPAWTHRGDHAADRLDEGPARQADCTGCRFGGDAFAPHRAANARSAPAGLRRRGADPLHDAGALQGPRFLRAAPLAPREPVRGRRGPLREPMGPRLPSRLFDARFGGRATGPAADTRAHGDGHGRGPPRHRAATRLARPGCHGDRLCATEPPVRGPPDGKRRCQG